MSQWLGERLLKEVERTAERHCANYYKGGCLLMDMPCFYHRELDDGEQVQRCAYFENAVLDNEPHVQLQYVKRLHEYLDSSSDDASSRQYVVNCSNCGSKFIRTGRRQTRCESCQAGANRRSKAERQRRYRSKKRQSETL